MQADAASGLVHPHPHSTSPTCLGEHTVDTSSIPTRSGLSPSRSYQTYPFRKNCALDFACDCPLAFSHARLWLSRINVE